MVQSVAEGRIPAGADGEPSPMIYGALMSAARVALAVLLAGVPARAGGFESEPGRPQAQDAIDVADLSLRVSGDLLTIDDDDGLRGPLGGEVRVWHFRSAASFGRFSDPVRIDVFPADGRLVFELEDVPFGEVALVLHHDEDADGEFDKNFIGIPREPIAITRGYRPKGPPVYARAVIVVGTDGAGAPGAVDPTDETSALGPDVARPLEMELFRVLGRAGLFGVGIGVLGRSSPYVGGGSGVFQPIPAITYNGSRLQWFGPSLRYGLLGSDQLRLAATARYRLRPYEEDDSDALAGLGDREDTLMAGLAVISELPLGVNLSLGYEHDVLDRIGGGQATLEASRAFQWGAARLSPNLGVNWVSSDLADHDFGISAAGASPGRPAYDVGSYTSLELGISTFFELNRNWRIVFGIDAEFLPGDVTRSPIVDQDVVFQGFAALTYTF